MDSNNSWLAAGRTPGRSALAFLIFFHIVIYCISLIYTGYYDPPIIYNIPSFHVFFDPARWYAAAGTAAVFALVSYAFVVARFSFGYFVGFYLYTMIFGYLWINCFSDLHYDHRLAGLSAVASIIVFLVPALFITSPVRQPRALTERSFDRLLTCILIVSIATVAIGATYDFHIVSLQAMYEYRAKLNAPTVLNYLLTIVSSALLPFAFAGFVTQKAYWRAAAVLAVLLTLYPIAFNKVAILTPLWLVTVLILSHLLEARLVTILSLLAPILAGMLLILAFGSSGALVFATINFRMLTIPSVAMDIYNDFFAAHDLTYFCQISILKRMMPCPYQEPLSIVMQNAYGLGYFNASLFATEGIASVGPLFAPVPAFVCGLVIALANRLSAGLSPRFILISGAVFAQTLLNVPMTTTLLTHGLAILLLLWYLTPRSIFERNASSRTADRPEIHTR